MEPSDRPRRTTYTCVVGHEIPEVELDDLTHIQDLDAGARVRLCKEHGAPIAESIAPLPRTPQASP